MACITKDAQKYEFGSTVLFSTSTKSNVTTAVVNFRGDPNDNKTLEKTLDQQERLTTKLTKIVKEEITMAENENKTGIKETITGLGQVIIGEIETIAGIVNADPLAQAEGEFNVEVGTIREEIEEDLEKSDKDDHPAGGR